jgi:hypothetical protein
VANFGRCSEIGTVECTVYSANVNAQCAVLSSVSAVCRDNCDDTSEARVRRRQQKRSRLVVIVVSATRLMIAQQHEALIKRGKRCSLVAIINTFCLFPTLPHSSPPTILFRSTWRCNKHGIAHHRRRLAQRCSGARTLWHTRHTYVHMRSCSCSCVCWVCAVLIYVHAHVQRLIRRDDVALLYRVRRGSAGVPPLAAHRLSRLEARELHSRLATLYSTWPSQAHTYVHIHMCTRTQTLTAFGASDALPLSHWLSALRLAKTLLTRSITLFSNARSPRFLVRA